MGFNGLINRLTDGLDLILNMIHIEAPGQNLDATRSSRIHGFSNYKLHKSSRDPQPNQYEDQFRKFIFSTFHGVSSNQVAVVLLAH
jgi:hypothetical protein